MNAEPERRLLATIDQPRFPPRAFSTALFDRLQQELSGNQPQESSIQRSGSSRQAETVETDAVLQPSLSRRVESIAREDRKTRPDRRRTVLAVAASLIVLIAGTVGLILRYGDDESQPGVIPAVVHETLDDLSVNPHTTSILAATIDLTQFDSPMQSDWNRALIHAMELDPGSSYVTDTQDFTCCHGIAATLVVDGELTVMSEGEVHIYHAHSNADAPDRAELGTAAIVAAGDVFVHAMHIPVHVSNEGDKTASYVTGFLHNLPQGMGHGNFLPDGYRAALLNYAVTDPAGTETIGPIALSVDKVIVGPGRNLVIAPSEDSVPLSVLADGAFRLSRVDSEDTRVPGIPSTLQSAPRAMALDLGVNQRFLIENESKEPAVLYVLRFSPADDSVH